MIYEHETFPNKMFSENNCPFYSLNPKNNYVQTVSYMTLYQSPEVCGKYFLIMMIIIYKLILNKYLIVVMLKTFCKNL